MNGMQTRQFGASGRQVSEIGLGCWQLGAEWGDLDDARAEAVLTEAERTGISFVDTADVYGRGRSEERIGRYLRGAGKDWAPFIASKVGRFPEPGWPANFEPATIRRHVEASLARLGVAQLDLVQLHCVPSVELEKMCDVLRALRDEGLIAAFGASVESSEDARRCLDIEGLASLQVIFNVLRQHPRDAFFDEAARRGVAIIVRLPLASGLLSGRYDSTTTFAADDHRNFNVDGAAFHVGETFGGFGLAKGCELVDEVQSLAATELPLACFAQRWILDHPAVSTVITGATRAEQVAQNASCSRLPKLDTRIHEELAAFYERECHPLIRGEL